jgi:hypothetical protein
MAGDWLDREFEKVRARDQRKETQVHLQPQEEAAEASEGLFDALKHRVKQDVDRFNERSGADVYSHAQFGRESYGFSVTKSTCPGGTVTVTKPPAGLFIKYQHVLMKRVDQSGTSQDGAIEVAAGNDGQIYYWHGDKQVANVGELSGILLRPVLFGEDPESSD